MRQAILGLAVLGAVACSGCGGDATIDADGAVRARMDAGAPHDGATSPRADGSAGSRTVEVERGLDPALAMRAAEMVPSAADDASLRPEIVYPQDQTAVPPNLYLVKWQWRAVSGADLYVTTLTGRTTSVTYVSTTTSFVLSPSTWRALALGSLTDTIEVTVRAARRSNLSRAGSATIHVEMGPNDLMGGLYYFSTTHDTSMQGIFRYDFGVPVAAATRFLSQDAAGGCVGCHALSRDGSHMGVTFEGGFGFLATLDVTRPASYLFGGPSGPQRGGFLQYFDNDRGVLAVYDNMIDDTSDPLNGRIRVYDTATGMADDARQIPLERGTLGSHIAVAPDGLTVAFVQYSDTTHRPIRVERGSIRVTTYDPAMRSWSTPRTLVAQEGTTNNYYPSFSPDGRWLLFNRAVGDAYDNEQATIWVVRADGSAPPIELAAANRMARQTNSWPRWAPFVQRSEFGNERMWFAFSSKRDYGLELVGQHRAQLWMASFDPAAADAGHDGSRPAFWLPFQDIATPNHTPSWTERVQERECTTDSDCVDATLRCDPATHQCIPMETLI